MTDAIPKLCLILSLGLASAAAQAQDANAQDAAQGATAAPPAAAAPATNSKVGTPPEGKGPIVFVREGETELGKLRNGNYFVLPVDPGTHQYTVHSEAKDVLTLEVEAGETYYVQGTITMGVLAGRPNLSPSDQAAFDALAPKLKPSK